MRLDESFNFRPLTLGLNWCLIVSEPFADFHFLCAGGVWATQQNSTASTPTKNYANAIGQDVFGSVSLSSTNIYVDYIYLDTDERRRFAQVSHEYFIQQ